MALAALVLSVVAIAVSAVSVWYTRVSADAAMAVRAIEAGRRLGERRPRLSGNVGRIGSTYRLTVTLESDEPLAAMDVRIPYEAGGSLQGVSFAPNISGVYPVSSGQRAYRAFACDPLSGEPSGLRPRDTAIWKVEVDDKRADTLRLEATCRGEAGEMWDAVLIQAPVDPGPPRNRALS